MIFSIFVSYQFCNVPLKKKYWLLVCKITECHCPTWCSSSFLKWGWNQYGWEGWRVSHHPVATSLSVSTNHVLHTNYLSIHSKICSTVSKSILSGITAEIILIRNLKYFVKSCDWNYDNQYFFITWRYKYCLAVL